jgi:hypothetical protein
MPLEKVPKKRMTQKSFVKIILVVVVVILLGAAGYLALVKKSLPIAQQISTSTPTSTKTLTLAPTTTSTSTPITTQRSEESFIFVGKRPTGSNADLYKGYVIVEGEYYEYYPETLGGGILFFKLDEQYRNKLPKKYGEHSQYFAFDNDLSAKQMLKINESVFKDKSICKLSGRAKIAIENYTAELIEGDVWDHTKLAQVISSTAQTTETCSER